MKIKTINITVHEYESVKELDKQYQSLIDKSKEAVEQAYAPYSEFKVGASVLLENGMIFSGNNQENAAYPSGICAERVAVFYANATYPNVAVKAIAICAKDKNGFLKYPIKPCGACRQVLLETEIRFNKDIDVILYGTKHIELIKNVKQLLPLQFDKTSL